MRSLFKVERKDLLKWNCVNWIFRVLEEGSDFGRILLSHRKKGAK